MSNCDSLLEWEVLLDESDWNRPESLGELLVHETAAEQCDEPAQRVIQSRPRVLGRAAGVLLLFIVLGGIYLWQVAETGLGRIYAELEEAVEAEEWLQQSGGQATAGTIMQSQADPERQTWDWQRIPHIDAQPHPDSELAQVTINSVDLRPGLALVRVAVSEATGGSYRETRFYRREANDGWLRTSPAATFWGPHRTMETTHFRIHYRQKDAHIVDEVVVHLDAIYADLRADVGLPPATKRLIVEVSSLPLDDLGYLAFTENRLLVPSPLLLQAPADYADDTILTQTIVGPLVDHVQAEAQQQAATHPAWNLMMSGLQLWQARAGNEPMVQRLRDTMSWLSSPHTATDEDPQHMCHEYRIWRHSLPNSLYLPEPCAETESDQHSRLVELIGHSIPRNLDGLGYPDSDFAASSAYLGNVAMANAYIENMAQKLAAAMVIDYVVSHYGRGRLPGLVAGFRTHGTWDRLVPAVFGVSVQEFERGWQAHMAAHRSRAER